MSYASGAREKRNRVPDGWFWRGASVGRVAAIALRPRVAAGSSMSGASWRAAKAAERGRERLIPPRISGSVGPFARRISNG
jgi:hypothetical protein